jgi:GeoRSP system SPASM domain protein
MNLRELTWPVRIYWDLPSGPDDVNRCLSICEEFLEIKVLFLSLQNAGPVLSQPCCSVLDRLTGRNSGISLTVSSAVSPLPLVKRLSGTNVRRLLREASSFDDVRALIETLDRQQEQGPSLGISFDVRHDNCHEIPEVVSACLNSGIRDLVFPIQRLEEGKACFYVARKHREELLGRLRNIDRGALNITIHDPFLWELFFPDKDYHEGGCQAANSMLYISPGYKVYPCPAMPLQLGDLQKTTLREIILSARKKELRSMLLRQPVECEICDLGSKCLGGCRGRAYIEDRTLLRLRDPACRAE